MAMPLLAVSAMNRWYLDAARRTQWDVLDNRFATGFEIQEKLALASLAVRVRALLLLLAVTVKGPGRTRTLADLRPGSSVIWADKTTPPKLLITLPLLVTCERVAIKNNTARDDA